MQEAARKIKDEVRRRQASLWYTGRTHAELLGYLLNLMELEFPAKAPTAPNLHTPPASVARTDLRPGQEA